jgi:hypothetical protein
MLRLAKTALTLPSTTLSRTGLFTRSTPLLTVSDKSVLSKTTSPLVLSTRPEVQSTPVEDQSTPPPSTTQKTDGKLTEVPDVPSKSEVASINGSSNERIETLKQVVLQERQTMKKTRPKRMAAQPEAREQWLKKRSRMDVPDNLVKNQTTKRTKTH